MSRGRLPVVAFALLALATVGAFFLTQHLKTRDPLVWHLPKPLPSAINPTPSGRAASCRSRGPAHQLIDYRRSQIKFAVSRSGSVGVYIVSGRNAAGNTVATITSGTEMRASPGDANLALTARLSKVFTWDGRQADGAIAPDGTYYFRIELWQQGRSVNDSQYPVQVMTHAPHPRILSVQLVGGGGAHGSGSAGGDSASGNGGDSASGNGGDSASGNGADAVAAGPALLSPPQGAVRITFSRIPGGYRRVWIDIYRTDVSGRPQLVHQFPVPASYLVRNRNWTTWNGEVDKRPVPAGAYLVGITAQDQACNQAKWPVVMPPAPDTTPHAGITVRYLTVTPPLTPTVSGSRTGVAVDSPDGPFTWTLRRAGTHRLLAQGSGAAGSSELRVRMPRRSPGLYTLSVRSGTQSASVPLVASQAGAVAAHARVLVVLPMLTWMGDTAVDDSGDGLPDTLAAGDPVSLVRPLVDGRPRSMAADAALLNYLDAEHLRYQLTTDVALAEGRGPSLVDRWGVLFADGEHFLPSALASRQSGLDQFVKAGGRVLALGTDTFMGTSSLSGSPTATRAGAPTATRTDLFGAKRGSITPTGGDLITELTDKLGLFDGVVAFSGFSQYQPISPPTSPAISAAGIADGSAAIAAFRDGSGIVTEVGLPDFGASLVRNVDSQELLTSAWRLLAKQR